MNQVSKNFQAGVDEWMKEAGIPEKAKKPFRESVIEHYRAEKQAKLPQTLLSVPDMVGRGVQFPLSLLGSGLLRGPDTALGYKQPSPGALQFDDFLEAIQAANPELHDRLQQTVQSEREDHGQGTGARVGRGLLDLLSSGYIAAPLAYAGEGAGAPEHVVRGLTSPNSQDEQGWLSSMFYPRREGAIAMGKHLQNELDPETYQKLMVTISKKWPEMSKHPDAEQEDTQNKE